MPEEITASPSAAERTRLSSSGFAHGVSLSRIQSIVAILAGSATVFGAAASLAQGTRRVPTGTLVAIVHPAGSARSASDATVEVLTTDNAVVATLTPDADGRATLQLREGVYQVRVSEPRAAVDVHRVAVQPGQTIEVKATLRAASSVSVDRSVTKGMTAVKRALGLR